MIHLCHGLVSQYWFSCSAFACYFYCTITLFVIAPAGMHLHASHAFTSAGDWR